MSAALRTHANFASSFSTPFDWQHPFLKRLYLTRDLPSSRTEGPQSNGHWLQIARNHTAKGPEELSYNPAIGCHLPAASYLLL
ncbi:hypothetical protein A0H81_14299 [Grifola frondosa]|uniref:Uncharacterized protein n=1 Tax=Grifola frondosa TaxID=5627 RepID=A0A1C7LP47_GRIFR|nr:hypothetical protein A0H81_14299 [Grifola frondosa]